MPLLSRKWLALYGLVGSLGYLSQNYTVDGLQHLALKPLPAASESANAGSQPPIEAGGGPSLSLAEKLAVALPSPAATTFTASHAAPPRVPSTTYVHIAGFHANQLATTKLMEPWVLETLLRICEPFDVVALQGISEAQPDTLPRLVEALNQRGKPFDFVIGPRVGRGESKERFAFLFNTATIETDRHQLYTVEDKNDLLEYEPLVGWFRSKAVAPERAFTFTLVNVRVSLERFTDELTILPELLRSIQRDGRHEDDVILIGDMHASDSQLQFLNRRGIQIGLQGKATSTRGTMMLDNVLFSGQSTNEFTGKSGVIDFLREQNLSMEAALSISDHLPIWAEFFAHEGGDF